MQSPNYSNYKRILHLCVNVAPSHRLSPFFCQIGPRTTFRHGQKGCGDGQQRGKKRSVNRLFFGLEAIAVGWRPLLVGTHLHETVLVQHRRGPIHVNRPVVGWRSSAPEKGQGRFRACAVARCRAKTVLGASLPRSRDVAQKG